MIPPVLCFCGYFNKAQEYELQISKKMLFYPSVSPVCKRSELFSKKKAFWINLTQDQENFSSFRVKIVAGVGI